jgi:hypothetical protein
MSSSNRREYLTATTLDQALLDRNHDNLESRLEMITEIETPAGTIYASDRNKYVGGVFYEALLTFPAIGRTVGEWLSPELQFSTLTLEISNSDSRFNNILPGGASYNTWVGKSIVVKIGLAEQASTYKTIFQGTITDVGGFKRSVKSITVVARDNYEKINVNFPTTVLNKTAYPNLSDNNVGRYLPVIYGDWTVNLDPDFAAVPTYALNLGDANVIGGSFNNIQFRISENDLISFDTTNVWLKRGDVYYQVPSADVVNVGAGNKTFEINQDTANLWVEDSGGVSIAYKYASNDEFYVRVKGKDLGAFDDNLVSQAKDLLLTYGGLSSGDFDANWETYRDKATPSQSAISTFKSRVWENEPKPLMQYVLSMLEQVRLEAFIDRNLKLKINSLHFEDWDASPSFTIRNWDVVKDSFAPSLDERNNFNRLQGVYDYRPNRNENANKTPIFRNSASVTAAGKAISKQVTFPNLYIPSQVDDQTKEILKIASSLFEVVTTQATWRSMLLDIGEFVLLNVQIGSSQFDNVPAMIRDIGYDPNGLKISMKLWSTALLPFPGYTPGYSGTTGGSTATITQE